MSRTRLLHEFSTPEGRNVTFDYHGSTGLLKSRVDSRGLSVSYVYDINGRLTSAVSPTGEVINLTFDLSLKGASVQINHGDRNPVVYFIKGSSVSKTVGTLTRSLNAYCSISSRFSATINCYLFLQ